ncbi:unnamed protein product (macronuclear) [Paramecium tetraurelia]|uniref:Uncharacterized protein n=1 Tax=Paramecium tetraurelia TaxID=5888 RepID=A0CP05_PARTE|nr:uncharacterized protein GSPATT00038791001 [Paramecium tetraurelia]CAK72522.1 unnamed protein product [Paramecium tetraurelia]|eukprot:XP_001439919.1 hypothetical protein (macronuclear) [Paramecium tetraurelia strain d4-2]
MKELRIVSFVKVVRKLLLNISSAQSCKIHLTFEIICFILKVINAILHVCRIEQAIMLSEKGQFWIPRVFHIRGSGFNGSLYFLQVLTGQQPINVRECYLATNGRAFQFQFEYLIYNLSKDLLFNRPILTNCQLHFNTKVLYHRSNEGVKFIIQSQYYFEFGNHSSCLEHQHGYQFDNNNCLCQASSISCWIKTQIVIIHISHVLTCNQVLLLLIANQLGLEYVQLLFKDFDAFCRMHILHDHLYLTYPVNLALFKEWPANFIVGLTKNQRRFIISFLKELLQLNSSFYHSCKFCHLQIIRDQMSRNLRSMLQVMFRYYQIKFSFFQDYTQIELYQNLHKIYLTSIIGVIGLIIFQPILKLQIALLMSSISPYFSQFSVPLQLHQECYASYSFQEKLSSFLIYIIYIKNYFPCLSKCSSYCPRYFDSIIYSLVFQSRICQLYSLERMFQQNNIFNRATDLLIAVLTSLIMVAINVNHMQPFFILTVQDTAQCLQYMYLQILYAKNILKFYHPFTQQKIILIIQYYNCAKRIFLEYFR